MHTGFTLEYVKRKGKRPEPSFQARLVRILKSRLTKQTAFFAVPDEGACGLPGAVTAPAHGAMTGVPDLIFVHGGRAFGLELKSRNSNLSDRQRAAHVALRDAGMRVEVARDLDEALMHLRDMGIPLTLKSPDLFRHDRAA